MDKEKILEACFEIVNKRITEIQFAIRDANNSIAEDTKSSAGDKYEIGREMIQQDLNRFQQQLLLANEDAQLLERLRHSKGTEMVTVGSLVGTDRKIWYFISVSIGRLALYPDVYAVSAKSPIGKLFLGKEVGNHVDFNNQHFVIKELL